MNDILNPHFWGKIFGVPDFVMETSPRLFQEVQVGDITVRAFNSVDAYDIYTSHAQTAMPYSEIRGVSLWRRRYSFFPQASNPLEQSNTLASIGVGIIPVITAVIVRLMTRLRAIQQAGPMAARLKAHFFPDLVNGMGRTYYGGSLKVAMEHFEGMDIANVEAAYRYISEDGNATAQSSEIVEALGLLRSFVEISRRFDGGESHATIASALAENPETFFSILLERESENGPRLTLDKLDRASGDVLNKVSSLRSRLDDLTDQEACGQLEQGIRYYNTLYNVLTFFYSISYRHFGPFVGKIR